MTDTLSRGAANQAGAIINPNAAAEAQDFLPLKGIDHVEFWVGNAKQAAHYYRALWGFTPVAYAGLETGVRDRASHVVEQGRIRFVLTAPLHGGSELSRHVADHGDGVKVVALAVPDADEAYRVAVRRGAQGLREPEELSDDDGTVRVSQIATYGETVHTFVERDGYDGGFLPGFRAVEPETPDRELFAGIDHVVGNVELGRMETWVSYYEELPGRIGEIDENLADLRDLGILADRDDEGYLLQIFSKPLSDRPTLFIEVIERHGARGFGEGNFKALFEAIEREQERRGNL